MKTIIFLLLAFLSAHLTSLLAGDEKFTTYSIVAYHPLNGDLGIAVQSKFLGVGPVVLCEKEADLVVRLLNVSVEKGLKLAQKAVRYFSTLERGSRMICKSGFDYANYRKNK